MKTLLIVAAIAVAILFVVPAITGQPLIGGAVGKKPPMQNPTSAQTANTPNGFTGLLRSVAGSPAGQQAVSQGASWLGSKVAGLFGTSSSKSASSDFGSGPAINGPVDEGDFSTGFNINDPANYS